MRFDMLCSNFMKFGGWEVGEIARCLADKKKKFHLALQLSLLRRAQNLPRPAPDNDRVLQI